MVKFNTMELLFKPGIEWDTPSCVILSKLLDLSGLLLTYLEIKKNNRISLIKRW